MEFITKRGYGGGEGERGEKETKKKKEEEKMLGRGLGNIEKPGIGNGE